VHQHRQVPGGRVHAAQAPGREGGAPAAQEAQRAAHRAHRCAGALHRREEGRALQARPLPLLMDVQRVYSFEFFPPKTVEGKAKLRATWQQLAQLKPRFFSVTFGAGGSTREGTLETVTEIRAAGHEAAPHISCVASTKAEIAAILAR